MGDFIVGQPGTNWANSSNITILPSQISEIEIRNNYSYGTVDMCGPFVTGNLYLNTMVTTQQATISDAIVLIELLWFDSIGNRIKNLGGRSTSHSIQSLQPFTHVACLSGYIVGVNDTTPIYFPNIFNPLDILDLPQNFSFSGLTKSELAKPLQNVTENILVFVDLVGPEFSNATTGAILLTPLYWHSLEQQVVEWEMDTCYISSGWGISNVTGSSDVSSPSYITKGSDFSAPPYQEQGSSYVFQDYPLTPTRVTAEWANYLNPLVVELNTTVINILCSADHVCQLDLTLALMITNGLALTGGSRGLERNISWATIGDTYGADGRKWFRGEDIFTVDPVGSEHWAKLEVNTQVVGLVYATRGLPIKLAIVILAMYIVVASVHFIYTCVSGFSSTSWHSISEVTALAVNSPPTEDLQGTCAGIEKIGIFRIPVRILAARGNSDVTETEAVLQDVPKKEEHLELVFGDVDRKVAARYRIIANEKYGTLKTE